MSISLAPKNSLWPQLRQRVFAFHDNQDAATATEYVIILVLIAVVVIGIVKVFGETLQEKFYWANQRFSKFVTAD